MSRADYLVVVIAEAAGWLDFLDQALVDTYIESRRSGLGRIGPVGASLAWDFSKDLAMVAAKVIFLPLLLLGAGLAFLVRFAGDPVCFSARARVSTVDGDRAINVVEPGTVVWSWETRSRRRIPAVVLARFEYAAANVMQLKIANLPQLEVTGRHSLLSTCGWKKCSELRPQSELLVFEANRQAAEGKKVLSIESTEQPEPVFNLLTAAPYSFICGGTIAHSFTAARSIREVLHTAVLTPIFRMASTIDLGARATPLATNEKTLLRLPSLGGPIVKISLPELQIEFGEGPALILRNHSFARFVFYFVSLPLALVVREYVLAAALALVSGSVRPHGGWDRVVD